MFVNFSRIKTRYPPPRVKNGAPKETERSEKNQLAKRTTPNPATPMQASRSGGFTSRASHARWWTLNKASLGRPPVHASAARYETPEARQPPTSEEQPQRPTGVISTCFGELNEDATEANRPGTGCPGQRQRSLLWVFYIFLVYLWFRGTPTVFSR